MKTRTSPFRTDIMYAAAAGLILLAGLTACGRSDDSGNASARKQTAETADPRGVGPIKSVELGPLDEDLAARGAVIFSGTCAACHKMEQRYVGPAIAGVTQRRTPEWIMNMIMNPAEMTQKDPVAKAMLAEYMTQMSVSATEAEARALLEYFRKMDGEQHE